MNQHGNDLVKDLKVPGIVLIVLGVICVLVPAVAGGLVVAVIGVVMLIAGVALILQGLKVQTGINRVATLILGAIMSIAALLVIGHPLLGLAFLTLLLVFFFVSEGVWKILTAFRYRPAVGWQWLMVSGAISLLLGLVIWSQWPVSGSWAIGILVGVSLISTGMALTALASAFQWPK